MGKVNQLWQDTVDGVLLEFASGQISEWTAREMLASLIGCRDRVENEIDAVKQMKNE